MSSVFLINLSRRSMPDRVPFPNMVDEETVPTRGTSRPPRPSRTPSSRSPGSQWRTVTETLLHWTLGMWEDSGPNRPWVGWGVSGRSACVCTFRHPTDPRTSLRRRGHRDTSPQCPPGIGRTQADGSGSTSTRYRPLSVSMESDLLARGTTPADKCFTSRQY